MLIAALRHGETAWNVQGRMQGRADIALSSSGVSELMGLSLPACFDGFTWFTSPLGRAQETAKLLGMFNAIPDDRLIETDWGAWEGKTIIDLRQELGGTFVDNETRGLDFRPPNGESPHDVRDRIFAFLIDKASTQKQIGLVTHKGVIRALLSLAYDWDMKTKAPEKLEWRRVHLFELSADRHLSAKELNIPLQRTP